MDKKRSSAHYIVATVVMGYKVIFDEELTAEEAEEKFYCGEHEDILDEDFISTVSVSEARPF